MIRNDLWISVDNFRRQMFLKNEIHRLILKSSSKNETNSFILRYFLCFHKSRFSKYSTIVTQRNRCVVTGRVWNVIHKTKYSRFVFRAQAYAGDMPGCKKATW